MKKPSALVLELRAAFGGFVQPVPVDEVPLWVPREVQPGRGITLPDGRVCSPQELAVESPADELFFGGGLGGGKTHLLLGLALTRHRHSIVFRREFTQFEGAAGLLQQSEALIGLRGVLNRHTKIWRGLPGGRALEFGAAREMRDALKYKGRPHDLKGFDEVTEIPESVYRFLIGADVRRRPAHARGRDR